MKVLVLNSGSSSLKYKLVDTEARRTLVAGLAERLGRGGRTHADAIAEAVAASAAHRVDAVGHRVVHGGARFVHPTLLDPECVAAIEECVPLAPAHNPHNLAGIRAACAALPGVPQVAVFDTAFHATLPRRARTYAIDGVLAERLGLRRYGFHGTSHAFVAAEAARALGRPLEELRLVTLHLGNGASACAVERGSSTETSMGLTPLEGLVMGSRCGDLDPGLVLRLLREPGASLDSVEELLGSRSGLAGLSGVGNDLRDLEARAAEGHDPSRLAIAVFSHRVRKYIGAYAAVMGGLDAVVFTGGIGQNAVAMRRRILQRLEFLGVVLDEARNAAVRVDEAQRVAEVSAPESRVRVLVVATDEELRIAELTAEVAAGLHRVGADGAVGLAVSRAHVHLDAASLQALFPGRERLTPRAPLSQPGLFLAEERVDVLGPRERLAAVPVVGPLRERPQVEVCQSDEFRLGLDAPRRPSGRLDDAAPVTLVGPGGSLSLAAALINPMRHLHLDPADARARGLRDGDRLTARVERSGAGERPLEGVLVRVQPGARPELHVDEDEARALGLPAPPPGEVLWTVPGASVRLLRRRPTLRLEPKG